MPGFPVGGHIYCPLVNQQAASLRVLVHSTGPTLSVKQVKFTLGVVYHLEEFDFYSALGVTCQVST